MVDSFIFGSNMAPREPTPSELPANSNQQAMDVVQSTHEKPQGFLRFGMHIFWIGALFLAFKGLTIYMENQREEVPIPVPVVVKPKQESLAPSPQPVVPETPTSGSKPEVTAAPALESGAVAPKKAVSKVTTCSELKDVSDYWSVLAKKPQSEDRRKWLEERIQDVQAQKTVLGCG